MLTLNFTKCKSRPTCLFLIRMNCQPFDKDLISSTKHPCPYRHVIEQYYKRSASERALHLLSLWTVCWTLIRYERGSLFPRDGVGVLEHSAVLLDRNMIRIAFISRCLLCALAGPQWAKETSNGKQWKPFNRAVSMVSKSHFENL